MGRKLLDTVHSLRLRSLPPLPDRYRPAVPDNIGQNGKRRHPGCGFPSPAPAPVEGLSVRAPVWTAPESPEHFRHRTPCRYFFAQGSWQWNRRPPPLRLVWKHPAQGQGDSPLRRFHPLAASSFRSSGRILLLLFSPDSRSRSKPGLPAFCCRIPGRIFR